MVKASCFFFLQVLYNCLVSWNLTFSVKHKTLLETTTKQRVLVKNYDIILSEIHIQIFICHIIWGHTQHILYSIILCIHVIASNLTLNPDSKVVVVVTLMVNKLIKWCFQHLLNRFWVLQTYSSQCFFISTFRIRPCSMWELDETLWICLIGAASWFSTQLLSLPWYTHAEVSETHQCNRVINHFCCGFPQQWFEVWSFTSTCWPNNVTVSSLNVDVREQYWNSYFKNAVSSDLGNWVSVAIR